MAFMRTDTPRPVRLTDYAPPAFLIDQNWRVGSDGPTQFFN